MTAQVWLFSRSIDELLKDLKGVNKEFKTELTDFLKGFAKKVAR